MQIILKQPGPFFGVKIVAGSHHGEFENPDNHGGEHILILAVYPDIQDQTPGKKEPRVFSGEIALILASMGFLVDISRLL